MCINCSFLH